MTGSSFLLTPVMLEAEHERHAMEQSEGLEERVERRPNHFIHGVDNFHDSDYLLGHSGRI